MRKAIIEPQMLVEKRKKGKKKTLKRLKSLKLSESPSPPQREEPMREYYLAEIVPGLFIADYQAVGRLELLQAAGIGLVVNLTARRCPNRFPAQLQYLSFDVPDDARFALGSLLCEVAARLAEALAQGRRVVVHCHKGISRAPTMVIAYLMLHKKMDLEAAFDLVREKSAVVDPNAGFLMQLAQLPCN